MEGSVTPLEVAQEIGRTFDNYEWTEEDPCWLKSIYVTDVIGSRPYVYMILYNGSDPFVDGNGPHYSLIRKHYYELYGFTLYGCWENLESGLSATLVWTHQ
jgi:hypothetical protein